MYISNEEFEKLLIEIKTLRFENSILKDTNISYTPFLKGRILHALLSVLLIIIIP